jgi:hypothetical protein
VRSKLGRLRRLRLLLRRGGRGGWSFSGFRRSTGRGGIGSLALLSILRSTLWLSRRLRRLSAHLGMHVRREGAETGGKALHERVVHARMEEVRRHLVLHWRLAVRCLLARALHTGKGHKWTVGGVAAEDEVWVKVERRLLWLVSGRRLSLSLLLARNDVVGPTLD